MIPDQKKYTVTKNKLLPVIGLDLGRYPTLRKMLANCYNVCNMADEDGVLDLLGHSFDKVEAVLFEARMILDDDFSLIKRIGADEHFVEIPIIAVCDTINKELCERCIEAGVNEYIEPPFNVRVVPMRIRNAVRAKDSVTFHEMELMLRELPSNIYLKDAEGKYIFSAHYWHHLKAKPQGWTIRGKTEFDIQKDHDIAVKASEADKVMFATRQGSNYILELHDDGIEEFVQVIKSPTYDRDGNINGIIAIMNDVTELETLKRRLERRTDAIEAELKIAAKIQSDMLPYDFEGHDAVDIAASMTPAKNVGGDFYDFFFIDDDHLGLIMADVSGKGVPASLFMTVTKIVIHDRALVGGTPAEILHDSNARICSSNKMGLFVTVWFGILDLKTGIITYANAGHEYPVLRLPGGNYELIKTDNYAPIGADDESEYFDDVMDVSSGGSLFLYTDGVPDAKNAEGGHFSEKKMVEALNHDPSLSPAELISHMKEEIHEFAQDTDPFDDITMMCVKYKGKA